jgi:hypothetical protein
MNEEDLWKGYSQVRTYVEGVTGTSQEEGHSRAKDVIDGTKGEIVCVGVRRDKEIRTQQKRLPQRR